MCTYIHTEYLHRSAAAVTRGLSLSLSLSLALREIREQYFQGQRYSAARLAVLNSGSGWFGALRAAPTFITKVDGIPVIIVESDFSSG